MNTLIVAAIGPAPRPPVDLSSVDGSKAEGITVEQWRSLLRRDGLLLSVAAGSPSLGRRVFVVNNRGVLTVQAHCREIDSSGTAEWRAFGAPVKIGTENRRGAYRWTDSEVELVPGTVALTVAALVSWLKQGRPDATLRGARWASDPRSIFDPERLAEKQAADAARAAERDAELAAFRASQEEQRRRSPVVAADELAELLPKLRDLARGGA